MTIAVDLGRKATKQTNKQIMAYFIITECPESMNPDKMIPARMKKYLRCSLASNCFGLTCCLEHSFKVPLSDIVVHLSVPFFFELDPCNVAFHTGIGAYEHREQMLHYDWSKCCFYLNLSYDVASESEITSCNKIDNH